MLRRPGNTTSGSAIPPSPPLSSESTVDDGRADFPVKKSAGHMKLFSRVFMGKSEPLSQASERRPPKSRHGHLKNGMGLARITEDGKSFPGVPSTSPNGQGQRDSPETVQQPHGVKSLNGVVNSHGNLQFSHEGPLPGLQSRYLKDTHDYEPLMLADLSPDSFDLVPVNDHGGQELPPSIIEQRAELIFSKFHLQIIFQDYWALQSFIEFIAASRPQSLPLLRYYLTSLKALAAIGFANSVINDLKPISYHGSSLNFTEQSADLPESKELRGKIATAFHILARDDLPAFVTHSWMNVVEVSMKRRVTGLLPSHLRDLSEGLAETFCLTDPSKTDNPIIFASEEFYRTTQYGTSYAIGRNCRFLQGPKTDSNAVARLKAKLDAGQEHNEILLNYRRDGSPFLNLLMCTPLRDFEGNVRYFLGAQVDVSGLATELSGLEYLKQFTDGAEQLSKRPTSGAGGSSHDNLQKLAEMLNDEELDVVHRHGGRMHHPGLDEMTVREARRLVIVPEDVDQVERDHTSVSSHQVSDFRLDGEGSVHSPNLSIATASGGHLGGVYEHYILVRPAPSLRILFASPSLRIPGLLQSSLLDRIGGPARVRQQVTQSLVKGQSVTANILWITKLTNFYPGVEKGIGRPRWLHATPLLSASGAVGVWMIVLIDDDSERTKSIRKQASYSPVFSANGGLAPAIKNSKASQPWDEAVNFEL